MRFLTQMSSDNQQSKHTSISTVGLFTTSSDECVLLTILPSDLQGDKSEID